MWAGRIGEPGSPKARPEVRRAPIGVAHLPLLGHMFPITRHISIRRVDVTPETLVGPPTLIWVVSGAGWKGTVRVVTTYVLQPRSQDCLVPLAQRGSGDASTLQIGTLCEARILA